MVSTICSQLLDICVFLNVRVIGVHMLEGLCIFVLSCCKSSVWNFARGNEVMQKA